MSYLLNSLQDRAVGHWSFSGTLNDLTSASNTATGTASFTSPPLIAIGGSAMRVTSTASVVINSKTNYQWLTNKTFTYPFSMGFWFNFNNQLDGSNYGNGIYKNDQLNIFYVKNSANNIWDQYTGYSVGTKVDYNGNIYVNTVATADRIPPAKNTVPSIDTAHWSLVDNLVARVYYDYLSNTFRFSIPGTSGTNTEAHAVISDFDTNYYILISYINGNAIINVNGVQGKNGTIADLPDYDFNNYKYIVDGSTSLYPESAIGASATNFLINSLEFFSYSPTLDQIKKKFLWAHNDGKPNFQARNNKDTSFFDFYKDVENLGTNFNINGYGFSESQNININNLSVDNQGIKPLIISPATIYNKSGITSNGISFTNGGSVVWSDFGSKFNLNSKTTISAQIFRSKAAHEHIFYLNNLNGISGDLYLEYDATISGSTKYILNYKNNSSGSVSTLINLNTNASVTTSNVALSFNSGSITLYVSESSNFSAVYTGSAYSGQNITMPIKNSNNSFISIGNYDGSLIFTSSIKNVGITDYTFSRSTFNFTTASSFMIKLTSSVDPTVVSQHGSWKANIALSTFGQSSNIMGTQIEWGGMDSARVYVSSNASTSYTLVNRGVPIPGYDFSAPPKNLLVDIEIDTDYTVTDSYTQAFNYLNFIVYSDLTFNSNSTPYSLSPISSASNNYVTQLFSGLDILNRPNNFGIKFSGTNPNPVTITIPDSTIYYGIDLWYRPDYIASGSSNYILSNITSSATSPAIWLNASAKFKSLGGTLYINGASVVDGSYQAKQNEIYHLFLVLSSSYNNNLYLNGASSTSNTSVAGTYGYLQFWGNSSVTPTIASARYQSFIDIPRGSIVDNNTTTYTDSVVARKIGI